MLSDEQLQTSRAIQRRTGRTFHIATRFLPERVRHPTYVLYAFFRTADEVVDDPDPAPPDAQRRRLDRIRAAVLGRRETEDPVLAAVDDLRHRHDIPDREFEAFLDAMAADIESDGYDTHDDLESYLRGSAVAVAYMMLAVMDPDEIETARPHAKALGEAFQLTNFLRDVREDVTEYGRIYLPRDTLARHGVSPDEIADLRTTPGFRDALHAELRRTEERYREGVAGIQYLPEDCRFPVLLAAVLYAEYHRLIREREYDVLSGQPSLGVAQYIRIVGHTWLAWRRHRDPETVFYRVSPIAADPPGETEPSARTHPPRASGRLILRRLRSPLGSIAEHIRARWPLGRPEWP